MALEKKTPALNDVKKKPIAGMELKAPGARFFAEVSRLSIIKIDMENPFKDIVLYELNDVDTRPLDVSKIPPEAWPYPKCLFVSVLQIFHSELVLNKAHYAFKF